MLKEIIVSPVFSALHSLYCDSDSCQWPDWACLMKKIVYQPENASKIMINACIQVCHQIELNEPSNVLGEECGVLSVERLLFQIMSQMQSFSKQTLKVYDEIEIKDLRLSEKMEHFFDLKCVARKGWTRVIPAFHAGVGTGVETVNVHCIKTAVLASMLCPEAFEHVFLMGLIHDHAELVIGDLTPSEVSNRAEKNAHEMKVYCDLVDDSELSELSKNRIKQAFDECMTGISIESQWVHIADKLDMALQAHAYEEKFKINLQEFYDSAEEDIIHSLKMITSKKNCDT